MKRSLCLLVMSGLAAGCLGPGSVGDEEAALQAVQQGVDRAGEFSPTEADALKRAYNSPAVSFTGVYIGGPCNGGSGWTEAGVTAIYNATKWGFLPIYVGQQSSAICGAHNLTAAQGTTDGKEAVTDLKAFKWYPGLHIPIALDLEAGAYSSDNAGAVAYAKSWAAEVAAAGYDPYVYSSVTALNAIASAGTVVVGAWPACWLVNNGTYTSGLSPSGINKDCVLQLTSYWTSRPGIWQYNSGPASNGDNVDYDVATIAMAPVPGTMPAPPADMAKPAGTDGGHAVADGGTHDGAGTGGGSDAGGVTVGEDGGTPGGTAGEDGGVGSHPPGAPQGGGCSIASASPSSSTAGAVLLLGCLGLVLARRRRHGRS